VFLIVRSVRLFDHEETERSNFLSVWKKSDGLEKSTNYQSWGGVLREQKWIDLDAKYRYGYQGKYAEKDEETGWNHFELREYNEVIGRTTTMDPARQFHSSYLWVGNNPISGTDPTGGVSPIADRKTGKILGADSQGWGGDILFMDEVDFKPGMDHSLAEKIGLGIADVSMSKEAWSTFATDVWCFSGRSPDDLYGGKISVGVGFTNQKLVNGKIQTNSHTTDSYNDGTFGGYLNNWNDKLPGGKMRISLSMYENGQMYYSEEYGNPLNTIFNFANALDHEHYHGTLSIKGYTGTERQAIDSQRKSWNWPLTTPHFKNFISDYYNNSK